MSIFSSLMDSVFGSKKKVTAFPGVLGELLAQLGIHELGPVQSGTPMSVLTGCRKSFVIIPGSDRPAIKKNGKPMISKDKNGRDYQVMDQYAVSKAQWKSMQRNERRKAEGKAYTGEPLLARQARLAQVAA